MSTFKPDAGIPLLTEVIEVTAISPEPEPAEAAPQLPPAEAERWARLERELQERVLQQVLKRIDSVLEQRVRDSLADVLQTAVDGLAADIRSSLQQSVEDAVKGAVMLEIEAARSPKN